MVGNLFLYALTDADPLLADFKRDESGATDVSGSQIHQDGIDHIKAHAGASDLSSSQVPGQQGSEATSGGLPSGAGGVSSTAYTGSPVSTEEQKPGVVDQTVETVRNYLEVLVLEVKATKKVSGLRQQRIVTRTGKLQAG